MKKQKPIISKPIEEDNIYFETFRKIGSYEKSSLASNEPSCFTGIVRYKKYKITVELIEESNEVYAERLQKMWDICDNHHHWQPLKNAAASIGYTLQNSPGTKKATK